MSDRVAVMYLGRIVEAASASDLFEQPLHPYTEALLAAVPIPDPHVKRRTVHLVGDVPSPSRPPTGCAFHTRCPIAVKGLCDVKAPVLAEVAEGRRVACHLRDKSRETSANLAL
jgi:oligopeptide transport system ATP-binding protein